MNEKQTAKQSKHTHESNTQFKTENITNTLEVPSVVSSSLSLTLKVSTLLTSNNTD